MTTESSASIEQAFWRLFRRIIGREIAPGSYRASELEEWDSLRHIELIFELEESLGLTVAQDDIPALYSDTDTFLRYLKAQAREES